MSQLTDFTKPLSAFPKIKGVTLESDPLDGADVEQPAPIDQPTETQHKLDSYIAANRESTPPTAVANRRVPRASIAELNQTDMDEIRRRLLTVNRDNRSPAMKVLDLIDAPRNVIMGLVAPSLRSKAEQSGDTGAFGLGRVQFSDVLRDLGLNNRVATGLLGFVGDVAFDPLTYVGPAGWGAELVAKTGTSLARVGLRQAGTKVLRREIANVAAGGLKHVADETAHAYLLAKGFTPERVAELVSTNGRAGAQSAIAKEVFGDPSKSILEKVFRPLGGEKTFESASGNLASDLLASSGPAKEAAAAFVAKYGKGTGRALRIGAGGKAGSEVLHVPFMSDLTVQVPAFTAKARANARNIALAKQATLGVSEHVASLADPFLQTTESIVDAERGIRSDYQALASERAMHEELLKSLPDEEPPPPPAVSGAGLSPVPDSGGTGAVPLENSHVQPGGKEEGRKGLLSPDSATTTPPAVDEAAGALPRTQRERVLGEARVAFSNVPPEQHDAWAALMDARAQTWAREGKGRTPDQFWEQLRVEKGKAGEGQLYQPALHGSPHRFGIDDTGKVLDPKAFSLSAIGSGEGAQAYTRGLYFTQSDDVQRHYRNLGSRGRYLLNNTLVDDKTVAQRVLNLAESYMSSTDAVDIQRRVSSALQRGGAASAIEQAESAYIGKYFNDWDAAARQSNPALYQLAKERHGWDAAGLSDLAADVKSSPLASTGDKEIDEAIRATLPEYKPDPDSDAVVHMLRGLEDPPRETRVELRPRSGVRAMRSMSESDKSALFEIESRMHWAHGATPAEKLESVKGDLRRTVDVQSDWKARYEREWSDRFGGTPRLLTQAETNKIVDDIEKAILDTLGSSDELADDLGKVQRDLSYWNEVDGYVNGNLIADGTIRTQAIEDMLKRHLGASDAAKVIASEAWSAVESGLSRPSAYHYWDEAASIMKKAQSALDVAEKYDIQAVKLVKPGATYKVELAPTDEDLVWWDKPISENPAKVQQAVLDMYPIDPNNWEEGKMGAADGRHFLRWDGPGGVGVVGIVSPELNGMWAAHSGTQMPNANNLIDYFSSLDDAKAAVAAQAHKAVDEYLSKTKAGSWLKTLERDRGVMAPPTELLKRDVRGVKYLDGMSRADGQGSYNFVIYDDKDVTITEALLQRKGKSPLASLSFEQDGKAVMRALKSPNITSLVHESSHLFLPGLADQDLNVVARVYGVTPELLRVRSEQLPVADRTRWVRAHEHFARDFEKYTATGKAPTKELESVFAKLKDWFVAIYKKIIGTPLEREIDPRIRGVFDRMLGGVDDGSGLAAPSGKTTRNAIWKRLEDSVSEIRSVIGDQEAVVQDKLADYPNATRFYKSLPADLKMALQRPGGDSVRRQFFRVVESPDKAGAEDVVHGVFGGDWDAYVDYFMDLSGSGRRKTIEAAEMSAKMGGRPDTPFWKRIWDRWPGTGRKSDVISMDALDVMNAGPDIEFSVNGDIMRTALDEDGNLVVRYGDGDATVPAELVGEIPVDRGSVRRLSEDDIAGRIDDHEPLFQRDAVGQQGLFGARVGKLEGHGKQGELFRQTGVDRVGPADTSMPLATPVKMIGESDADYAQRLSMHRKWAASAKNTGSLFQSDTPDMFRPFRTVKELESERWAARERELRDGIQGRMDELEALRNSAAESLAAFDPKAAAAGVQNPNDVLRLGEMLSEADAALQSAITRSHWLNMAKAAVQKDELGVRAIDVEDAADLAQQLGDDLYHLVASDPDAADKLSDAVQARMQALGDYRESLRSTLQAVSSSDDDQIVDAAKMVLGTDDEQIVLSAFAPMGHFLRDKFGEGNKAAEIADKMDRFWRRTFGVRRGFLNQTLAEIKANYTKTSASTKMHAQAELLQTVKNLGLNLPPEEAVPFFHAWVWQRMDPERNRFFWWKMGPDGENLGPSELATLLQRATDNGVFANPATAQKLDEAADRFIEKLRVLGESEQDQGILGLLRQDYIPSGLTREAEQAAREHRAAGSVSQGGSKGGFPTQAFQKAKTTDQVRFPVEPSNPDGPWRRFFVGEMYLADVPDEALTPERLASKQSILDYLARAEADPQFAATYTPRPTDPWELNDLAASGDRFQHLTGGMPLESLFDTDLAALYGKRMGSHVRAEAVQDLGRLFLTNGVRIDPALLDKFGQFKGMSKRLEGGTMAKIIGTVDTTLEGGSGMAHAVQIGDTMYRRLDPRVWTTQDNVFSQMLGRLPVKAEEMLLHHAVADHIEAVYKFGQPDTLEKFLRATDTLVGMWKQLTLFHPSWVVGNMVGDAMLAISGGADPTHFFDPRNVRDMIRIRTMMHQPEKLKDMVLTLRTGQEIPARDFLQMAVDNRIIDNALTAEAMAEIAQKTPGILSIPDRVLRKHLGFWFRGNQITQDAMRMNAFLSYLNQGYDAVSAQRRVLASMFDYGDFTRIEERLFRRLFPFYSWIRNNLGYQIMLLGERPMWAGMAPKLQTALQEMAAGEATVPDNQRPTWMRNALATQIGTDPNKRFALMLGNLLPTGDLLTALQPIMGVEGAMQFLHYFAGNLTPAISTPLQAGTGTEFFSGRTIGSDSLGGDVSIGENLLGLVRPVSEAKAIGRAYEQGGIAQAASRLVLAGRVQAFDQQRLDTTMRRDFRDEEQRLRASIYKAERRGNTEVSQRARAALLALYRDALKRGMDDMVPKWAEDQLQALAQTQPAA